MCVCVCVCVSCLVMSDSLQPHRLQPHQSPLSMGFFRQEHWNGLPFLSPNGTIKRKKVRSLSYVRLFANPWTVAYQAPQSTEFSRQEYWSGLSFPSPSKIMETTKIQIRFFHFVFPCFYFSIQI